MSNGLLLILAVLLGALTPSCATAKRVSGAAAAAFYDCTAPGLRARIEPLAPLIRPTLLELAQLETPDTTPLKALTRGLVDDLKSCAVPVIGAALAAAIEATPATHGQQIDPGRVRAIVRAVADAELGGAHFKTPAGPL